MEQVWILQDYMESWQVGAWKHWNRIESTVSKANFDKPWPVMETTQHSIVTIPINRDHAFRLCDVSSIYNVISYTTKWEGWACLQAGQESLEGSLHIFQRKKKCWLLIYQRMLAFTMSWEHRLTVKGGRNVGQVVALPIYPQINCKPFQGVARHQGAECPPYRYKGAGWSK